METLKLRMLKAVACILLLVALALAALSGVSAPGSLSYGPAGVSVVYASGCDGEGPPPDLNCYVPGATPTVK